MTTRLFRLLHEFHHGDLAAGADARNGLNVFINRWPNLTNDGVVYRWNYNRSYKNHGPGWWSGMATFLGTAVLVAAYESFNDTKYLDFARRALHSALRSPEQGGSIWREGKKCWISEYSWEGMKQSDEFYVLNGHLFGLQALKMVADALQDEEAESAYRCAVRGTAARVGAFILPNWSLYMLNKPTIDPLHYVIFELSQFESLFTMTREPMFAEEASRRRALFASLFPIFFDPQTNDLVVSRIGAPHPYFIDIYDNQISCMLNDGSKWTSARFPRSDVSIVDRGIIRVRPPSVPKNCDFVSFMGNQPVTLYSAAPVRVLIKDGAPLEIKTALSANYDASLTKDRRVTISPKIQQPAGPDNYQSTKATITLSGDLNLLPTELFGVELISSRRASLGVSLSDTAGRSVFRYYPAIEANIKTQILLSLLGFDDYKSLGRATSITLTFYTDADHMPDQSDFIVQVGGFYKFPSALALEQYFVSSGATVPDLMR
jgi:hypothetical protein